MEQEFQNIVGLLLTKIQPGFRRTRAIVFPGAVTPGWNIVSSPHILYNVLYKYVDFYLHVVTIRLTK